MGDSELPLGGYGAAEFGTSNRVPEVGDLMVGVPQTYFFQILSVSCERMHSGNLFTIGCIKEGDGEERTLVIPGQHLNWLGDHWLIMAAPYRISIDDPLRADWFVTDPDTQVTSSCVACSASEAVEKQRELTGKDEGVLFAGQLYSVSVSIDGDAFLANLVQDLVRRNHPRSPFYAMDFSEGAAAQLRVQLAGLSAGKRNRFAEAVEKAWATLTCGEGFWWMMEGPSWPHCVKCSLMIGECECE